MTVFKTTMKIINKNKFMIIMYTAILIIFTTFNMQTSENTMSFEAVKPDVVIINNDNSVLSEGIINYFEKNANIVDIKDDKKISDALFYREINYILYIPKNYEQDFLSQKNPQLEIKSTGDYQASLADMLLRRYINLANNYLSVENDVKTLVTLVDESLANQSEIIITSKINTSAIKKASFYYNFLNYSVLAGCVFVICLIISSFKNELVHKRTVISAMNYKTFNRHVFISTGIIALLLWIFYSVLSFILIPDAMMSMHGLIFMLNSFVFTMVSLALAFLIANILKNQEAINGLINVIALGSSFLCGAFVPLQFLPDSVVTIAHILPSYWFIKSNDLISEIEIISIESLQPIFINMGVLLVFTIVLVILTNIISKRRQIIA